MGAIVCTVEEACELMGHMDRNDTVILTIVNKKTYIHEMQERIKKSKSVELINSADNIGYQDNDFFGVLLLYGVAKEEDTIHSILFPQLE